MPAHLCGVLHTRWVQRRQDARPWTTAERRGVPPTDELERLEQNEEDAADRLADDFAVARNIGLADGRRQHVLVRRCPRRAVAIRGHFQHDRGAAWDLRARCQTACPRSHNAQPSPRVGVRSSWSWSSSSVTAYFFTDGTAGRRTRSSACSSLGSVGSVACWPPPPPARPQRHALSEMAHLEHVAALRRWAHQVGAQQAQAPYGGVLRRRLGRRREPQDGQRRLLRKRLGTSFHEPNVRRGGFGGDLCSRSPKLWILRCVPAAARRPG